MCTKKGQKLQKRTFKLTQFFKPNYFKLIMFYYHNYNIGLNYAYMPFIHSFYFSNKVTVLELKFYYRQYKKSVKSWSLS